MPTRRLAVRLAANFEANLSSVEAFWSERNSRQLFDRLLDTLLETVVPNLEQFPKMGGSFLARQAQSVESQAVITRLRTKIGRGEIREYLLHEYLVLYALIGDAVYLLSIRHHQQLSFDLEAFWRR